MDNSDLQRLVSVTFNAEEFREDAASPRYPKVRSIIRQLSENQDVQVLDVGCAAGTILGPLAKQCPTIHLIGADINESLCQLAVDNGFERAIPLDASGTLPFGDAAFDIVFSGETLEHLVDTDLALSEFSRVLKMGGWLVVTVPNVRTLYSLARWFLNEPPAFGARVRSTHVRDFTTKHMRRILVMNGFSVQQIRGVDFSPFLRMASIADWLPSFSTQFIAVAQKVKPHHYNIEDLARSQF
jgi:ubiquinone/menaquinone biosynthesis C-methylase UbiE